MCVRVLWQPGPVLEQLPDIAAVVHDVVIQRFHVLLVSLVEFHDLRKAQPSIVRKQTRRLSDSTSPAALLEALLPESIVDVERNHACSPKRERKSAKGEGNISVTPPTSAKDAAGSESYRAAGLCGC